MVASHSSQKKSSGSSSCSRCLMIAVVAMLVLFLLPGGPRAGVEDDNLRTGQSSHSSTATAPHPTTEHVEDYNNYGATKNDDEFSDEVENAHSDIQNAGEEILDSSETYLGAAIATAGDFVKLGMTKMFGSDPDVTEDDINDMVSEVKTRLTDATTQELEAEAESILEHEENVLDERVQQDEDEYVDSETMRQDVANTEELAIQDMKQGMHKKTDMMREQMIKKAQEMEVEILEARLSQKLKKKVKLVIVDDEITGVDDLLDGLTALGGDAKTEVNAGSDNAGSYGDGSDGDAKNDDAKNGDFSKDDDGEYRLRGR